MASILDDSNGQDLSDKADSQFSLLKDLKELRIKSKRGRPRKNLRNKVNRAFKVPLGRRYRKKVAAIDPQQEVQTQIVDEAGAILEICINMCLILVKNKDSAISDIKKRLNV